MALQLEQLLNCHRDELNDRVLNMMRDLSRLNRVVEKFKIQDGLFWINGLEELERQLDNRQEEGV